MFHSSIQRYADGNRQPSSWIMVRPLEDMLSSITIICKFETKLRVQRNKGYPLVSHKMIFITQESEFKKMVVCAQWYVANTEGHTTIRNWILDTVVLVVSNRCDPIQVPFWHNAAVPVANIILVSIGWLVGCQDQSYLQSIIGITDAKLYSSMHLTCLLARIKIIMSCSIPMVMQFLPGYNRISMQERFAWLAELCTPFMYNAMHCCNSCANVVANFLLSTIQYQPNCTKFYWVCVDLKCTDQ